MKNQNDLIVSISAGVLSVILFCVFFFGMKRTPQRPADPTPVPLQAGKIAEGNVVMANALPGASNTPGGGAPSFTAPGGGGSFGGGEAGFRTKRGGAVGLGGDK